MKIGIGYYLFCASAIFFHSIELSLQMGALRGRKGSQPRLKPDLRPFRILPFRPEPYYNALRMFNSQQHTRLGTNTDLVARGNIIIGWDDHGFVRPLYNINLHPVFHYLKNHDTVPKTYGELKKMGVFHRIADHVRGC
ncbi:uncharacterized protein LOC117173305 [Belonocnema kinseyi]|uniref:uncharacterized protein LOC117173305 n=1 Tax=Belonocnema kinseyi TaxID=2817044 RepID=UPI00143DEDA3|nr:uncharacterized protein LOC117173305 [Belonocnema kinseyi]